MQLWQIIMIYLIGLVVVMYLIIVLPNKKKSKKVRAMHDSLAVGDEVTTIGGIIGTITERQGDAITLLIDPKTGTTMKVVVFAVQNVLEKAAPETPAETPAEGE